MCVCVCVCGGGCLWKYVPQLLMLLLVFLLNVTRVIMWCIVIPSMSIRQLHVFIAHVLHTSAESEEALYLGMLHTGDAAGLASWWCGSQPHLRQPCVYAWHSLEPCSRGPGCGSVPPCGTNKRRLHSSVSFIPYIKLRWTSCAHAYL